MKLRNLFEIMGFRKPARRYGYKINHFFVPEVGDVKYAQWLHPSETEKDLDIRVIREYRKFIHPGDFCIDVGAHSGDSTLPMAATVGKSGMVLALEPNPYVFPILQKNMRLNRDKFNIFPILAAACKNEGNIELEYSDPGYCNGGKHEGISVFRHGHVYKLIAHGLNLSKDLREDFKAELPKLKFIKTDAEGFDLYILEAIEDVITEFRPYVKSEIFKKTSPEYRQRTFQFFKDKSYQIFRINSDYDLWGTLLTPDNLMEVLHYDIFCVPENKTAH